MGKIIIAGEPDPKSENSLLRTDLFRQYARSVIDSQIAFHRRMRIAELRKSCGVESEKTTVQVRLPPRYG